MSFNNLKEIEDLDTINEKIKLLETMKLKYESPDPNVKYDCTNNIKSKGFTKLMKLCMMTNKYPNLHKHINKLIKDKSEKINAQNNKGFSALMLASINFNKCSSIETIQLLLENKVDINARNNKGWSSLMLAAQYSNIETVRLLLENKADINARNNGKSSLMLAVEYSNIETVQLLLENKA